MSVRAWSTIVLLLLATPALADDVLYRYEANVLPYDPSAGWITGDPCGCDELLLGGHLVLYWELPGGPVGYLYWIAQPPVAPPPTLWVEWRFRSNHPIPRTSYTCDGRVSIQYGGMHEVVWMYGDAAVSFGGDYAVVELNIDEFHTYRFESLDGLNYTVAVDGNVFIVDWQNQPNGYHALQFSGDGGCIGDKMPNTINEWDFVRYGTISYGELSISTDPLQGFVDARVQPMLDRFTVTYDEPNYVYIDEVAVTTTGGVAPEVVATRRLDNGPPETVEIVLDRPIPYNATTSFTIDDGTVVQTVEFTYAPGDTDGDGDADLADFAAFQNCFGASPVTGRCLPLDFNTDSAIDLLDFAEWQQVFAEP